MSTSFHHSSETFETTTSEKLVDKGDALDTRIQPETTAAYSDIAADAFDLSLQADLPEQTSGRMPEVESPWSPQKLDLSEGNESTTSSKELTVAQSESNLEEASKLAEKKTPEAKPRLKPGRPLVRSNRPHSAYLLSHYDPDSDSEDDRLGTLGLKAKPSSNETFNATIEDSFPPRPPPSVIEKSNGLDPNAQLERLHQLENENFQLKLKVTVLERHVQMKDSTKDLYIKLADSQMAQEQQKAEIESLKAQLQQANDKSEMRSRSLGMNNRGSETLDSDKDEMIAALSNAQEFYEQVIQGMLNAVLADGESPPDTLEDQLVYIEKGYLNALRAAKETSKKFEQLNEQFQALVVHEHQDRDRQMSANQTLDAIAQLFDHDGPTDKLPDIVADLLSNYNALEEQLGTHLFRMENMEAEIEQLQQQQRRNPGSPLDSARPGGEGELRQLRMQVRELTELNQKLAESTTRASTRNYEIVREFFQRMTDNFGYEWSQENKRRLRVIVDQARRTQQSKLPMLVDLMLEIVDELAQRIHESEQFPAIITEYEQRIKSLELLLTQELVRAGADAVLLARYRDLQHKLKQEEEKRKSEYMGYQRSLRNLQDSV